jgi:hypothetical protein
MQLTAGRTHITADSNMHQSVRHERCSDRCMCPDLDTVGCLGAKSRGLGCPFWSNRDTGGPLFCSRAYEIGVQSMPTRRLNSQLLGGRGRGKATPVPLGNVCDVAQQVCAQRKHHLPHIPLVAHGLRAGKQAGRQAGRQAGVSMQRLCWQCYVQSTCLGADSSWYTRQQAFSAQQSLLLAEASTAGTALAALQTSQLLGDRTRQPLPTQPATAIKLASLLPCAHLLPTPAHPQDALPVTTYLQVTQLLLQQLAVIQVLPDAPSHVTAPGMAHTVQLQHIKHADSRNRSNKVQHMGDPAGVYIRPRLGDSHSAVLCCCLKCVLASCWCFPQSSRHKLSYCHPNMHWP